MDKSISSVVLVTLCLKLMPYNFIITPHTWQCPVSGYEDKLAPGESLFAPLQMASDSNIIISTIFDININTIIIVMVSWSSSTVSNIVNASTLLDISMRCHHRMLCLQHNSSAKYNLYNHHRIVSICHSCLCVKRLEI